jgi:hypothetical protein
MELEGSLLHSQVPATCPYPMPDLSSNLIISEYSHVLKYISFLNLCVCVCLYTIPQKDWKVNSNYQLITLPEFRHTSWLQK